MVIFLGDDKFASLQTVAAELQSTALTVHLLTGKKSGDENLREAVSHLRYANTQHDLASYACDHHDQ
jgi:hypothetical protein